MKFILNSINKMITWCYNFIQLDVMIFKWQARLVNLFIITNTDYTKLLFNTSKYILIFLLSLVRGFASGLAAKYRDKK
jgi:hypothetical protein